MRNRILKVHYQYTTSNGHTLLGKSRTNDYTLVNGRHGDTIKIFASPDDETKSCIIPHLEAAHNNWSLNMYLLPEKGDWLYITGF